jgi:hypothetical protein
MGTRMRFRAKVLRIVAGQPPMAYLLLGSPSHSSSRWTGLDWTGS